MLMMERVRLQRGGEGRGGILHCEFWILVGYGG